MSETRWYRSLYLRIALGLAVFLVLMVAAQGALFVWMLNRSAGTLPASSPRRLAVLVASDVAAALNDNPSLDLNAYVREQYGAVVQSVVVIMRDGRVVSNDDEIPVELQEAIVIESAPERFGRGGPRPPRGGERRGPPPGRGGGPPNRDWEVAPILEAGMPIGRVIVLAAPPLERMLRQFAPTVATLGLGVLAGGALLIALFVFTPARRRLRDLETAAGKLGDGDLAARASERGGDEVAAVAHAFNRMADELSARADALHTSERARRQLLADVSHELSTPLTSMRGYVETLKMEELNLDATTRERYLGIIEDETHRLERLVGDLLDLARLEGGGGSLRRERVSTATLFERVAARHERDRDTRGNRIITSVASGAEFVDGDPDRLEQALENLTANALRHTPAGTEVRLSSSLEHGAIHLQVRDNGPGIPPEHLTQIFDRFYKADTSRHALGTGLGLSIVKAIVERHGGSISARNDAGSVFEIVLPAPATP